MALFPQTLFCVEDDGDAGIMVIYVDLFPFFRPIFLKLDLGKLIRFRPYIPNRPASSSDDEQTDRQINGPTDQWTKTMHVSSYIRNNRL